MLIFASIVWSRAVCLLVGLIVIFGEPRSWEVGVRTPWRYRCWPRRHSSADRLQHVQRG